MPEYTKEQLEGMSTPELLALKKQLQSQQTRGVLRGAAIGGLQGLTGQPITGQPPGSEMEQLLQKLQIEQAFKETTPSGQLDKLKLEQVLSGGAGRQPGVLPTQVPTTPSIEPTGVPTTDEQAEFIQIPDGVDEYGNPKFKTVRNPKAERTQKLEELVETEKVKARGEVLKLGTKARANFGRAVSLFSGVI